MSDHAPNDDWFPRLPRLRPGLRVVRRDDDRRQVGLLPAERVILPAHPDAAAFAAALAEGRRPDLASPGPRRWARLLVERGLVVEADEVAVAMSGDVPRAAVAAAYAVHGPQARPRVEARRQARIGLLADEPWADECRRLLAATGLTEARGREPVTALLAVAASGELPRDRPDPWLRAGLPHLLVTNVAARVTVGPFVAPGLTACLRCVDAHGSDRDPGHGVVLEQHGPAAGEPADPVLLRLALAWAVRDLVAYVEGDLPSTWSSSVLVDARLETERTSWTRHPRCGCAWGEGLATG